MLQNEDLVKFYILGEIEKLAKQDNPRWINSEMSLDQFMEKSGLNSLIQENQDKSLKSVKSCD